MIFGQNKKVVPMLFLFFRIQLKSLCNCNSDRAYAKLNDSICSHKCPGNPQESCGSNGIFTSSMWGLNIDTTNTGKCLLKQV